MAARIDKAISGVKRGTNGFLYTLSVSNAARKALPKGVEGSPETL